MHLAYPLVLSALLFGIGLYGVLARRNAVLVLASVELLLNAVILDLVAFDTYARDVLHSGQVLSLFVITLAAAETGVGLALILLVFRQRATSQLDELDDLREPDDTRDREPSDPDLDIGTDEAEPAPGASASGPRGGARR
jgi:NADH-quinone oxidoreductase subunit K